MTRRKLLYVEFIHFNCFLTGMTTVKRSVQTASQT